MKRPALIVCITAIVLLCAAIVVMFLLPEGQPEPEPTHTPPVSSATTGELINKAQDDVDSISFTPKEGFDYSISFNQTSNEFTLDSASAVFPGQQLALHTVFHHAITLSGLTKVAEDADDSQLAVFGFNEPTMGIMLKLTDGSSVMLELGAVQAAGQGRYAREQNSREVFLLSELQSFLLTMDMENLYDLSFFPAREFPDIIEAVSSINNILIETKDEVIELHRRTAAEIDNAAFGSSEFRILRPSAAEGNDSEIRSVVLESVVLIRPDSIESLRPADLSVYGLDAPVRLTVSMDNWSGTLLIGGRSADSGGRYVMIDGYDAVLLDAFGDYSFINASYSQLRTPMMWMYNITDVASVTFVLDGVTRVLSFEHSLEDESLQGWLDDKELSETNARRLFMAALLINQNGETDAIIPENAVPDYTVRIFKGDIRGPDGTLELYSINDSQYLIVLNGENTGLFTTRMALQQQVLNRFEIIDAGGDIPV